MAVVTLYQPTGVTVDCAVAANGTPAMNVIVNSGVVVIAGQVYSTAGGTVTISTADTVADRTDAIVVNTSGTATVITGTVNDGIAPFPPTVDPTMYALLAYVTVLNQASPSYTGTITSGAVTDERNEINLIQPAQSFIYTLLSATTSTDPGAGNCNFDSGVSGSIAHLYISYQAVNEYTGGGAYAAGMKSYLSLGSVGSSFPYLLMIRDRSDPGIWWLGKATALTDHSTYCDIAITQIAQSQALSGTGLSIATFDIVIEIIQTSFLGSSGVTTFNGRSGAVVPVTGDYAGCLIGIRNILNGTTSYTPTSGTNTAYVECVGGGGASQTGTNTTVSGAGGGGAYSASKISTVDAGAHTVAVGAGGAAGNHAGGDTSYTKVGTDTGTAPLAKGGSAGGTASANASSGGAGGASASGTGDIKADGGGGGGATFAGAAASAATGPGGSSFFGSGGAGVGGTTVANAGGLYGGGAGGAGATATSSAAGGNGLLRITEYT